MKLSSIKIALSVCFLFVTCAMANTAFAQGKADMIKNSTPEQRAQMQTKLMKTKLMLDTNEVMKVQAINLTHAQKMDPILKSGTRSMATLRQAREINNAQDKDLKGVLTAEQYKQYEDYKAEMKEKMKERAQEAKGAKSSI